MNWLDLIILVVLAVCIFLGVKRGVFQSLFSLLAIIAAFYLASYISVMFSHIIGNNKLISWVVFTGIFIGSAILLMFIGKFIRFIAITVLSGLIDRLGGFAIGALQGIVICGLLLFGVLVLGFEKSGPIKGSAIAPAILVSIKGLVAGTPIGIKNRFDEKLKETLKAGKELIK